jgi:RNA polymerase sigma factor (sigma-70 family)
MTSLRYFQNLARRHPPLPPELERELIRAAAARDDSAECARARERLVLHNLSMALKWVQRMFGDKANLINDAVSAAVTGLHEAAVNVEDRGKPFVAFASWYVRRELHEFGRCAHVVMISRYAGARCRGRQAEQTTALDTAASRALEPALSLDRPWTDPTGDEVGTLYDVLAGPAPPVCDEVMNHVDIQAALATLPPLLRQILVARFGLEGDRQGLEEIGARVGLSAVRVWQLEQDSLKALRQYFSETAPADA